MVRDFIASWYWGSTACGLLVPPLKYCCFLSAIDLWLGFILRPTNLILALGPPYYRLIVIKVRRF